VESRTYGVHIVGGDLDSPHGHLHGFETHFNTINEGCPYKNEEGEGGLH
jgi:hypothetical protein